MGATDTIAHQFVFSEESRERKAGMRPKIFSRISRSGRRPLTLRLGDTDCQSHQPGCGWNGGAGLPGVFASAEIC